MDRKFAGRLSLAGLMIAAGVSFAAAQTALNPLVIRSDRQQGSVPADCDESAAPASTPRIQVREIPLPEPQTPPVAPPSATLRDELRAVHEALGRNDRAAFDAHLAEVRRMVRVYPSGAEKNNAEQLLVVYSDVETLWDAQYESPFFAAGSKEHAVAVRYAGWEEAVRRSILTDTTGQKFYPARETRDFVARAVAEPLRRAGITPAPSTRTPGVTQPRSSQTTGRVAPRPQAGASVTSTPSPRVTTPPRRSASTASTGTSATPRRRSGTPARSTAAPPRSSTASASSTKAATTSSRPASPASAAPAVPSATSSATTPVPSTVPSSPSGSTTTSASTSPSAVTETTLPADPAPTGTGEPFVASDPSGTSSSDPAGSSTAAGSTSSDPYTTTATDGATTSVTADPSIPATPSRGRSVLLPMILILIGLGVLIVLFRMSK